MIKQVFWILFWSAVGLLFVKLIEKAHLPVYLIKLIICLSALVVIATIVYGKHLSHRNK